MYLTFANFRDVTRDEVPQRYEVYYPHPTDPWRRVIRDEAEWLARPDLWGVDVLPVSKAGLAEYYSAVWMADTFLKCPVCIPLVHALWPGGSFNSDFLNAGEWGEYDRMRPDERVAWERDRLTTCTCGRHSLHHYCRHFAIGYISIGELLNRIWGQLSANLNPVLPSGVGSKKREEWFRRRRESWAYGRQLALELCGPNPFRPISFADSWRSESVLALTRVVAETRNFSVLPILADTLEEAGCDQPDVLAHCRDPHLTHVRGCWVIDGLLEPGTQ
jgi:hypothetical protein